jgi:hypothetical protein
MSRMYGIFVFIRVASRFGILVRYRLVFSQYFTNQYQRKTWSGCFGIVHLAGTPFFPHREASAPFLMDQAPLLREKLVPAKFTKRSSHKVLQNEAPAKSYSTKIPNQIYQPASAGNFPIPAKLPVNRWDATLVFM